MKQWIIAHTQPCKEWIAQQHLLEQGFDVYLPRFKKTRRHARKVEEILYPLFPRYIFIKLNLQKMPWRSVTGTRGVSYLLMNNQGPAIVPSQVIDKLKEQENDDGLVCIDSIAIFAKGDKVHVLEGAFKNQTAVFETFDDKERVQLLLTFLGREIKISLPTYAVEAA